MILIFIFFQLIYNWWQIDSAKYFVLVSLLYLHDRRICMHTRFHTLPLIKEFITAFHNNLNDCGCVYASCSRQCSDLRYPIIIELLINVIAIQNLRVKSDTVPIVPSHLVNVWWQNLYNYRIIGNYLKYWRCQLIFMIHKIDDNGNYKSGYFFPIFQCSFETYIQLLTQWS